MMLTAETEVLEKSMLMCHFCISDPTWTSLGFNLDLQRVYPPTNPLNHGSPSHPFGLVTCVSVTVCK